MTRSVGRRLGAVLLAVAAAGCAGDNLFSLVGGSTGGSVGTVNITAPSGGLTVAQGAAVQVRADVTAPNGLRTVNYTGWYTDGSGAAYVAETESYQNTPFATLDNTLSAAAGQTAGDVWIIVEVVDTQGGAVSDTVTITIN